MQSLVLRKVNFTQPSDWVYKAVPERLCYLRDVVEGNVTDPTYTPWQRLKAIQEHMPLVYSDMYRSSLGSLKAYCDPNKKGVQKPGYSGHNFGISVDLAVDATMKRHKISYDKLVNTLIAWGWTPYAGITKDAKYQNGVSECWHFNFCGDFGERPWIPESPLRGHQAIDWIDHNIKFENDQLAINRMLGQLKLDTLDNFKESLPVKMHSSTNEALVRALNIMSCRIVDTDGNIIPG
jgi:hypothetical protein